MSFWETQQPEGESVSVWLNAKGNLIFWQSVPFAPPREKGGNKRSSCLLQWSSSTILIQTCFTNPASMDTPSWQCWHTGKPDTGGGGAGHCFWKKDTMVASSLVCHVKHDQTLLITYVLSKHNETPWDTMHTLELHFSTYFWVSSWHKWSKTVGTITTMLFPLVMWYHRYHLFGFWYLLKIYCIRN